MTWDSRLNSRFRRLRQLQFQQIGLGILLKLSRIIRLRSFRNSCDLERALDRRSNFAQNKVFQAIF